MPTYLNPKAISGFTEAQDQSVLTKNGSGLSWTEIVSYDDKLPLSVKLNLSNYSMTATQELFNNESISIRDVVAQLHSGRTVNFFVWPSTMASLAMPMSKLENIRYTVVYQQPPNTGMTYTIQGDCYVEFYDKQYKLTAQDSTLSNEPSYTWSASVITNPDDYITASATTMLNYATSASVVSALSDNIETLIMCVSGSSECTIGDYGWVVEMVYESLTYMSKTPESIWNTLNGSNKLNAILLYKNTYNQQIISMLCTGQTATTSGNTMRLNYKFTSDLTKYVPSNIFVTYDASVQIEIGKIQTEGTPQMFDGYGSAMINPHIVCNCLPLIETTLDSGKTLTVSSAGTYELTEATDCIGSGITPLDYCDYSYIFGLQCLSSNTIATLLYIDDFPSDVISDIEAASGTLQNHIDLICNDFAHARDCGTNICSITPETIEYDGETYRLWRFCVYDRIEGFAEMRLFGLMSDDIDVQYLIDNSMESDITKRFCPFVAVGYFDDGFNVSYPGNNNHFSLICVKTDDVVTQSTPTPNQLITDMYIDSLYRYPLPLIYNNALSEGYLTGVTDNTVAELLTHSYALYENTDAHYKLVDSVTISGNTYSVWVNYGGEGYIVGLTEHGLTFEDVFPQTIEGNLENIKLNNNPFVYMSRDINDLTAYDTNFLRETSKYSTIIRVR